MNRQLQRAAALVALLSPSALIADPSPEEILATASRYTVKVQTLNHLGFNQDEGGSLDGTGFLIDRKRGWILTNAHVATRSPSEITVSFKGGPQIKAKRIHVDALIDMAVMQIPLESIPANAVEAQLDCQSAPAAGASVLAYGHPWGLSYTASRGIVSGISWFYPQQMIQTDAAINSGNSGGPLISVSSGKVIGLNTATYKDGSDKNGTAVGLAEMLPPICGVISLLREGRDTRLRMLPIGIAASKDDLKPRVAGIKGTELGFEPGDIITKVNGSNRIETLPELFAQLRGLEGAAAITVVRGEKEIDIRTPLIAAPDPLKVKAVNLSGLVISEPWRLDDEEINPERNLVVDYVEQDSKAEGTEALASDQIISVNGRSFTSSERLYEYLKQLPADATVDLFLRGFSSSYQMWSVYRHVTLRRDKLDLISVTDG